MDSVPSIVYNSLCIPRKDGGRGLIAIEDCVELADRSLEVYVHGRQLHAARGDKVDDQGVF